MRRVPLGAGSTLQRSMKTAKSMRRRMRSARPTVSSPLEFLGLGDPVPMDNFFYLVGVLQAAESKLESRIFCYQDCCYPRIFLHFSFFLLGSSCSPTTKPTYNHPFCLLCELLLSPYGQKGTCSRPGREANSRCWSSKSKSACWTCPWK